MVTGGVSGRRWLPPVVGIVLVVVVALGVSVVGWLLAVGASLLAG